MRDKQKKPGSASILRKILTPLLIVMIFQALLVYGLLYALGVTRELEQTAFEMLSERAEGRGEHMFADMKMNRFDLSVTADIVNARFVEILDEEGMTADAASGDALIENALLFAAADELIYKLRRSEVTGIFVILKSDGADAHRGVYFRDDNVFAESGDYSDIRMERGPAELAQGLAIQPGEDWQPGFALESRPGDDCDYYFKPMRAAESHADTPARLLGAWAGATRILPSESEAEKDSLTYAEPLMSDGVAYGVIGVEIGADALRELLGSARGVPAEFGYVFTAQEPVSLGLGADFAYGFGEPVVVFGPTPDLRGAPPSARAERPDTFAFTASDGEAYVAVGHRIDLYPAGSPFDREIWTVFGIEREDALLASVRKIRILMGAVMLASFCVGAVGIIAVARVVTAPIEALARRIGGKDPGGNIALDRIGIDEIDRLSEAIERLSGRVADANRKLGDILELAETSIAVFEYYDRRNNRILYTKRFGEMFGLPRAEKNAAPLRTFMRRARELGVVREPELSEGSDRVYRFRNGDETGWLRLWITREETRRTGVLTDVSREIRERKRLEYDRDYDILTDVYNRRAFNTVISSCFLTPEKLGIAAVIMLDLDNLKSMNDTYGHDYGDKYIKLTAQTLKGFAGARTVVARLSGDEFIVFLHGYADKEEVRAVCERIRSGLNGALMRLPDGSNAAVRISAGVAWYPDDSRSADELMRYADFAMYMVKKTNKGQFREFDFGVYNKHSYLLYSKNELDAIIEKNLISYRFQPIVEVETGRICAYEALMRPEGETIQNPAALISLAKAHSRLREIETMSFFNAVEAFMKLSATAADCKLFVNSVASQNMDEADEDRFIERFGDFLSRVVVEVTEDERCSEETMRGKLAFVRRFGEEFALDDFGSGYGNESLMLKYSPNFIKIDMAIIRNVHADPKRQALTQSLIAYGRSAGVKILAEGVETSEEMAYLVSAGVDLMQGYYLCRPMASPPAELPEIRSEIARIRAARFSQSTE